MLQRRLPEWLLHAPTPSIRGFAVLSGFEAISRGMLVSVFPLQLYRTLADAQAVSLVYFAVGLASLAAGITVPLATRLIPRRFVYSGAALTYALSCLMAAALGGSAVIAALFLTTIAVVAMFVCFNAYLLDHIARADLGRAEAFRITYAALGWTVGPVTGVWLMNLWEPAPFLVAATSALALLVWFLWLRFGDRRMVAGLRRPAPSPLRLLPRFLAQPRLVAGWVYVTIRSCGWWVYFVYMPIYVVQAGLGEEVGGAMLSASNALLFLTPLILRWTATRPVRLSVRVGFVGAALFMAAAGAAAPWPYATLGLLFACSFFLLLLDVVGGLPFLMAVHPHERTEMSAIYASYRDVSGILSPGAAWIILLVSPLPGLFVACGAAMLWAWGLAGRLHPRLGLRRTAYHGPEPANTDATPSGGTSTPGSRRTG